MARKVRRVIFWMHLIAGIAGGSVILVMCVTGALLSFERNITDRIESDKKVVAPDGERLPPSRLLAAVSARYPDAKPSSISMPLDEASAATVNFGRERIIYVDPYSAVVLGEGDRGARDFFSTVESVHRYLAFSGAARAVGKGITGASNLLFLLLAITGTYIWLPRRFSFAHLRPVVWYRRTRSPKARDFNWHNVTGFWCSAVLIILTVTAVVMSYSWANDLVYKLTDSDLPKQQGSPREALEVIPPTATGDIDVVWRAALANNDGWRSISLKLPAAEQAVFSIDEAKSWNIFGRSTLTLDGGSGDLIKWEPYSERSRGQQLRSWIRFTHTGESFGIVGQIVVFVACLGGALLVLTGFSLAIRRLAAWWRRPRETSFGSNTV